MSHSAPIFLLAAVLVVTGCRTAPLPAQDAVPTPAVAQATEPLPERLDGEALVALAGERNPGLRALAAELDAAEGRLRQAALHPNPEAGVRQSDVPLSRSGEGNGRTIASLDQPIIVGGRRGVAMALARAERDAAQHRLYAARRALRRDTLALHARVLYLRKSVGLQMRLLTLAEEIEAVATTPLDRQRARIESASNELEVTRVTSEQVYAGQRLAVLVGVDVPVDRLGGVLAEGLDNDRLAFDQEAALGAQPELLAADAALGAGREALRLARAEAIPDLTVGLEGGYDDGADESFGGVGARMPIPLFNRNQGRIQEAEANLARLGAGRDDTARRLRNDLANVLQRLNEYDTLAALYRDQIVPASEAAMTEARTRFAAGEISFLDLLDTLRVHHRSAAAYLDYLYEFNRAYADLAMFEEHSSGS